MNKFIKEYKIIAWRAYFDERCNADYLTTYLNPQGSTQSIFNKIDLNIKGIDFLRFNILIFAMTKIVKMCI